MRYATALVLLAAVPHGTAAQDPGAAEPDTVRLAPVVVTATRLPVAIDKVPGSITVITAEQLRERGIRTVAEALRLVPGVAVLQTAGPGGLTSVFVRGGESDYVQVLVDGVQANEPGGAFDWAHLRADDIDRIEVVRGPASVLYGSDAVTGVVQIFTRAGGTPRIEASAATRRGDRFESDKPFATHAFDASLAGATALAAFTGGRLSYGVNIGHIGSTGIYAFNSQYRNANLSTRLQLDADAGDIALTARHNDNRFHYPTTGSGAVVDPNQFATGTARALGADAGFNLARALELRVMATSWTHDTRTEDPADNAADGSFWHESAVTRRRADLRANVRAGPVTVTAGVDRQWQHGTTALESVSAWGTFTDATDNDRTNTGVYGQVHGSPVRAVSMTLGARMDENSAFGSFPTARAAASWLPVPSLRLHAAAGSAFKEPTFFENYAIGFARGNPDLEPEESRSRELGAAYSAAGGRVVLGATWFDQRFRNLIQYTAAPPAAGAPNYSNVGSAGARGLELVISATPADRLDVSAHYTLTRTRVEDAGFGTDRAFQQDMKLLRRPEHEAMIGIAFRPSTAVRTLLDIRHIGERDDLDFTIPGQWSGVRTTLPASTIVDAGAELDLLHGARGFTVSLRIRNLLDTDHVEVYNFPRPGRVVELAGRTRLDLR
jgi:vitamin B12 transporter